MLAVSESGLSDPRDRHGTAEQEQQRAHMLEEGSPAER